MQILTNASGDHVTCPTCGALPPVKTPTPGSKKVYAKLWLPDYQRRKNKETIADEKARRLKEAIEKRLRAGRVTRRS
jgi:hypothetical protein